MMLAAVHECHEEADYRMAFGAMAQSCVDAVLFNDQAENFMHRRLLVAGRDCGRLFHE
jgi:hypothetical protein